MENKKKEQPLCFRPEHRKRVKEAKNDYMSDYERERLANLDEFEVAQELPDSEEHLDVLKFMEKNK